MIHFISIQNTYNTLEIGFFKGDQLVDWLTEDKISASKNCVPLMQDLLVKNGASLSSLAFIAVNQGPGPFTTLRVVISTVNGLSFANNIPLIGVDALDALLTEYQQADYPLTIALLNAFNNDVYFGIQNGEAEFEKGYKNIDKFLEEISHKFPNETVRFIGNGAALFVSQITHKLGSRAHIPDSLPNTATIQQIGLLGLELWKANETGSKQLQPLYLKTVLI